MENESLISWTPANMITIVLMAFVGLAIVGFVTRAIQAKRSQQAAA